MCFPPDASDREVQLSQLVKANWVTRSRCQGAPPTFILLLLHAAALLLLSPAQHNK